MHHSGHYGALGVRLHASVDLPQEWSLILREIALVAGCGEEKNILSSPDFEPRAVQTTENLCTVTAVPVPHRINKLLFENGR
jgi:hypothetical protein